MKAADLPLYYNAVDILERNLPDRADKVALYSPIRNMTFQEVSQEANQAGNALTKLGVRRGDYVGILCLDRPAWVSTFFGDNENWGNRHRHEHPADPAGVRLHFA